MIKRNVLIFALIILFAFASAWQAAAQTVLQPNTAFEHLTFELINIERAKQGLPPYVWYDTVAAAARANSAGSNNSNISQTLRDGIATVTGHHLLSYSGSNTPEQRVESWMNSDTARAAILRDNRTHIGLGIVSPSGSDRNNWTLIVISMIDLTCSGILEWEMRLLELTNIERANLGLPPLFWHNGLADAARGHSADLMRNNLTGHTGSNGSILRERLELVGITNTRFRAENCNYGQTTAETSIAAWMNSPGHRANILSSTATHMGAGLVLRQEGAGAQYASYWTVVFAAFR